MRHLHIEALEAGYRLFPAPPRDRGTVIRLVQRLPEGARMLPERVRVSLLGGVEGDRWSLFRNPKMDAQVTMMRADVARLMAQDEDIARFGDNLFVDLDLSEENLPAGTLLSIGGAQLSVTPKPHTGCSKFQARAGRDALEMTRKPEWLSHRLRGIHLRVVREGELACGDAIRVERRA